MPATYENLATTTLGSAQATVTFSSISANYTDLVVIAQGYMATGDGSVILARFNNDSGTNYSNTELFGSGTAASSARNSNTTSFYLTGNGIGWDTDSTQIGTIIFQIMNYSNSSTNKTVLSRPGLATASYPGTSAVVGLWRNTAAINRIDITSSGTFATGSTFTLYGIKAA